MSGPLECQQGISSVFYKAGMQVEGEEKQVLCVRDALILLLSRSHLGDKQRCRHNKKIGPQQDKAKQLAKATGRDEER